MPGVKFLQNLRELPSSFKVIVEDDAEIDKFFNDMQLEFPLKQIKVILTLFKLARTRFSRNRTELFGSSRKTGVGFSGTRI